MIIVTTSRSNNCGDCVGGDDSGHGDDGGNSSNAKNSHGSGDD